MLAALLLPLCAIAEGVPTDDAPDPDAPVEELVIYPAEELRRQLDGELHALGLVHAHRVGDKVIYRGRERWKPRMVVHDEGWVQIRDPLFQVDGLTVFPFPSIRGTIAGKRMRERAKAELVEGTAPAVRAWQDALAAEASDGFVPPRQDAPRYGLADLGRLAMASATNTHPDDWDGEHRALLPEDLERADRDFVDEDISARVTSDPRVLTALKAVPRAHFLVGGTAEQTSRQGPVGGPEGAWVSSAAQVAWAARAARVIPGSRVLELGSEVGYRAAVLSDLGATIHRVDESAPRLERLKQLVAGLGLEVSTRLADPRGGWADAGPFDAILVDPGVSLDPLDLAPQLAERGMLLLLEEGRSRRLRWEEGVLREERMLDLTAPDLSPGARRADHGGRRPWD